MTFRIVGLDARQFLQTFDYDNLDASGTFDGVLPIVFDADGGELVERAADRAHAAARSPIAARCRRRTSAPGAISRSGRCARCATASSRSPSTARSPATSSPAPASPGSAQGEGAKSNFLIRRLAKLPFVFNVRIEAPFRSLIGSIRSLYDPSVLIEQNLPTLIREQDAATPPNPFSLPQARISHDVPGLTKRRNRPTV